MKQLFSSLIWKDRNFLIFFFGILISKLGDKVYIIAIPWLVYELTESSFSMGMMFLIETLPMIFISPVAGVLADRFSRKYILILSALSQTFFIVFIPILHFLEVLVVWHIFILGFLVASSGACFSVLNGTIIPDLFNKKQLFKVNSIFQFMTTFTVLIGSALAGILINKIGVFNVLITVSLSFLPIIISIFFLKFQRSVAVKNVKSSSFAQLSEGIKYLITHDLIRLLTVLTLSVNIANGALLSMLIYFARDKLSMTSEEIGWLYSGAAVVQLIAILIIPVLSKIGSQIKLMLIQLFISAIGIIIVSLSWNWISLLIGVAIQSAPTVVFNVFNRTLRQKIVPSNIFGRVNGLIMMLSLGTLPLSGFITGMLADFIDIRYIFLTLALGTMLIVLRFWVSQIRNYEDESENM